MTISDSGCGILAIWNDCAPEHEADYESWYVEEHLAERVGLAGFRSGRRFEAIDARVRYFTYYETDSPAVLFSAAYLARLDNPSPRTQAIMPYFLNPVRTVCREVERAGAFAGGYAVTLRPAKPFPAGLVADLAARPGVLSARHWQAADGGGRIDSIEAGLRGARDTVIERALVVELAREGAAREVASHLGAIIGELGVYRFLCGLDHEQVTAEGKHER